MCLILFWLYVLFGDLTNRHVFNWVYGEHDQLVVHIIKHTVHFLVACFCVLREWKRPKTVITMRRNLNFSLILEEVLIAWHLNAGSDWDWSHEPHCAPEGTRFVRKEGLLVVSCYALILHYDYLIIKRSWPLKGWICLLHWTMYI